MVVKQICNNTEHAHCHCKCIRCGCSMPNTWGCSGFQCWHQETEEEKRTPMRSLNATT